MVAAVSALLTIPLVIAYLPETKGFQDQRDEPKRTRCESLSVYAARNRKRLRQAGMFMARLIAQTWYFERPLL